MARRVAPVLIAVTLLHACGEKTEERPPKYTAEPPANVVSCAQLVADPTLAVADGYLYVGGEPAQCAVTGLTCPLDPSLPLPADSCANGEEASARCSVDQWRLACSAVSGGAIAAAGSAGTASQGGSAGAPNGGSASSLPQAGRAP